MESYILQNKLNQYYNNSPVFLTMKHNQRKLVSLMTVQTVQFNDNFCI